MGKARDSQEVGKIWSQPNHSHVGHEMQAPGWMNDQEQGGKGSVARLTSGLSFLTALT